MQNSTNSNQQEQSYGLTNAENQNKEVLDSSVNKPIEGTPFWMRKYPDTGYFATLGKHRITDEEPTEEAVLYQMQHDNWNFQCTLIMAIVEENRIMHRMKEMSENKQPD